MKLRKGSHIAVVPPRHTDAAGCVHVPGEGGDPNAGSVWLGAPALAAPLPCAAAGGRVLGWLPGVLPARGGVGSSPALWSRTGGGVLAAGCHVLAPSPAGVGDRCVCDLGLTRTFFRSPDLLPKAPAPCCCNVAGQPFAARAFLKHGSGAAEQKAQQVSGIPFAEVGQIAYKDAHIPSVEWGEVQGCAQGEHQSIHLLCTKASVLPWKPREARR